MNLTTHEVDFQGLDALQSTEALCLFIGEDERPLRGVAGYLDWRMCGGISRLLAEGFFTGKAGEQLLLPAAGRVPPPRVFALGIGPRAELTAERLSQTLEAAASMLLKAKMSSVAFEMPSSNRVSDEDRARLLERVFLPKFKHGSVALLAERSLRALVGLR